MLIVRTEADFEAAVAFLQQCDVIAYDIETTGLNPRKDSIIGLGCSSGFEGFYVPIKAYEDKELKNVLQHPTLLQNLLHVLKTKKLLMHNGSFDGRFTMYDLGVDLVSALYCDTMLMKHTCDEEFPFGLKEIATKLWGADATEEKAAMLSSVKGAGGKPTEYFKASTELLAKYCVADCVLTYKLFNHYSKELKRQGLETFFYTDEVMPLYKEVVIPMEIAGIALDIPKLQLAAKEISIDIKRLEHEIQSALPHMDKFQSYFLDKEYPLKTFKGKAPVWTKKFSSQLEAYQTDTGSAYMFNLESKHHLKRLFFEYMGEKAISHTELGNPQVDDDFLELMASKHSWCADLRVFNKLRKLEGTYVARLLNESEDGRFYPSFHCHRTVSGRLAGDMQQLPRPVTDGHPLVIKHTNRIREFIIASSGNQLLSADYISLEPTIFSHASGDPKLQDIFNSGKDFYSEIAITTENLQGVSSFKSSPVYLGAINPKKRQDSKEYALGIPYGETGYKLQFVLNISHEEADAKVAAYLRAFSDLAAWINRSHDEAIYKGYVKTESGRIRHLGLAKRLFAAYGMRLKDSLQLWKDYNQTPLMYKQMKKTRKTFINLLNNSVNFKVQGQAASIMNRASIALARRLRAIGLKSVINIQIHDQIVLDVPLEERAQVAKMTKHAMESIAQLSVPLRTEPIFGDNLRQCK